MDRTRYDLFARTRLTCDEHRHIHARGLADDLPGLPHGRATPEFHLAPKSAVRSLGSSFRGVGLRLNELVDGLLKLVKTERSFEHGLHLDWCRGKAISAAVGNCDDRTGVSTTKPQTFHELGGFHLVAAQIDDGETEGSLSERFEDLIR